VDDSGGRRGLGWETALGGLVLLLGIVVWTGQAFELDLGRVGWPFFVIVPGLALLGVGLAATGRLGEVLATVGGLVIMAGLVLLVQNATDRFETWAYAWTLVVLVGAGIGRWLVGVGRGRGDLAASGGWLTGGGLVIFLIFTVFFEVVVGIGGRPVGSAGRYGLAALLIVAGLVLLGHRLLAARRPRACQNVAEPKASSQAKPDHRVSAEAWIKSYRHEVRGSRQGRQTERTAEADGGIRPA
jgi:hypothetical protein